MYQFSFTPCEFDMSHQEGTTKNAVLHKTAKMELSVFAPELFNCFYNKGSTLASVSMLLKKSIHMTMTVPMVMIHVLQMLLESYIKIEIISIIQ